MAKEPHSFKKIKKNASTESVINFLCEALPLCIKTNTKLFRKGDSEPKISTHINRILNNFLNKNKYPFAIEREPQEGGESAHADFGVYKVTIPVDTEPYNFFTFEAKRLPTPTKKDREPTEYVYAQNYKGGIQRYKENLHGRDLPINAMIGYIEDNDFEYWHTTINEWIEDIARTPSGSFWSSDEILQKIKFDDIAHLQSQHNRINSVNPNLGLHHFWLDIRSL
jgi:hypothetical protein